MAVDRGAPEAAWWRGAAILERALALAVAVVAGLWLFVRTLALLFAAIAVAEAVAPIMARLERRLPRALAVVLVYLVLAAAVAGLAWAMVPRLVAQTQEFATSVPALVARAQNEVARWDPAGQDRILAAVEAALDRFSGATLALPFALASSLMQIVLVFFMSMYWLLSAPKLRTFVLSLVSEPRWTDSRQSDFVAMASGVQSAVVADLRAAGVSLPDSTVRVLLSRRPGEGPDETDRGAGAGGHDPRRRPAVSPIV